MKLKLKKFIYLLNDATNALLKKDRNNLEQENKRLRIGLIVVGVILILMLALNIYFIL